MSVSAAAIDPPQVKFERKDNSQDWSYVVPLTAAIALGILFAPNFALGLAVGVLTHPLKFVVLKCLPSTPVSAAGKEYGKKVECDPLNTALFGPVIEECIFRGALQPLVAACIWKVIPATRAALLSPAITVAMAISIIATSLLFGLGHYGNYKTAHNQVILATIGGLIQGFLAAQYGLYVAIGAHIANNSIAVIAITLSKNDAIK